MPSATLVRSAIAAHHTATDDGAWDGPANEARLSNDAGASTLRRAFAWVDPGADADTKQAYRFVHHFIGADGSVGAASLRAAAAGIAVLNGARGGTTIPDSDRDGVWRHLAAHLRDGGQEPPDLRSAPMTGGFERRYLPIEGLEVRTNDAGQPTINWYPAVFDSLSEDLGGFREKIGRRAFTKTVQEGDIRALFNHDPNYVIGRNKSGSLSLRVDIKGLSASVTPPDTQWARDLMVSIQRGDISAGSFGFQVLDDRWNNDAEVGLVRELRDVKLFDVSVVVFPAYPATEGVSLRSFFPDDLNPDHFLSTLSKVRAGQPLAPEDRDQYLAVLAQLRDLVPSLEPPLSAEEPPADVGHSATVALRRRQLQLLRLKGGL